MQIEIQNCFSFWGTSSLRPPTGASPLDPTGVLLSPRPAAQDVLHILYQVYAPETERRTKSHSVHNVDFCSWMSTRWSANFQQGGEPQYGYRISRIDPYPRPQYEPGHSQRILVVLLYSHDSNSMANFTEMRRQHYETSRKLNIKSGDNHVRVGHELGPSMGWVGLGWVGWRLECVIYF